MNAKEMFEKLGYKKCDECISPVYIKKNDPFTWVNFCTTGVGISTQHGLGYEFLDCKLVKAINKQCEELGWLEEETCTNESEYNLVDGFECSNCGIIIENYNEIEIDEDYPEDRCMKEYAPRYCPNCGRKIVD
jgi:hypothetical protein